MTDKAVEFYNFQPGDKVVIREYEALKAAYPEEEIPEWIKDLNYKWLVFQELDRANCLCGIEAVNFVGDFCEEFRILAKYLRPYFEWGEEIEVTSKGPITGLKISRQKFIGFIDGKLYEWAVTDERDVIEYHDFARKIRKPKYSEEEINQAIKVLEESGKIKDGKVLEK